MAVHQYIGARYVPKFLGTYDPTTVYENLSVVDNGMGTSYISDKTVPAGTPLTDTSYWNIYGATSGAVINLQNQIGDINDLETNNTDDLVVAINEVKSVQNQNHIVIIGDSWADAVHDPLVVRMNTILQNRLGCTIHNYAYGGTGFDATNGYDKQLEWMNEDVTNDVYSYDQVKCIILVCGLNDHYGGATSATFKTRLQDWYDKAVAYTAGFRMPIYWFQNYSVENDLNQTNITTFARQRTYYDEVISNFNGRLIYVPTFGFISEWKSDERHPTYDGQKALCDNMVNIINGVPPKLFKYQRITADINTEQAPGITGTDVEVYIDYYVDFAGGKFESYMSISASALKLITSYADVTYRHTPPVDLATSAFHATHLITNSGYDKFRIYASGTDPWGAGGGRYYFKVKNTLE